MGCLAAAAGPPVCSRRWTSSLLAKPLASTLRHPSQCSLASPFASPFLPSPTRTPTAPQSPNVQARGINFPFSLIPLDRVSRSTAPPGSGSVPSSSPKRSFNGARNGFSGKRLAEWGNELPSGSSLRCSVRFRALLLFLERMWAAETLSGREEARESLRMG